MFVVGGVDEAEEPEVELSQPLDQPSQHRLKLKLSRLRRLVPVGHQLGFML